ncbi:MAG TPA: hypothetical protein VK871_01085 [Candidatus Limnocylindrales bacterium]|nr:hypothetical protein [Candidatus Limnocylindrales bacterium]
MNDPFEAATIHRRELDREIESIRTERLLRTSGPASGPTGPGAVGRARSGLGRGLISLGIAVLGSAESAHRSTAPTSDGCA